MPRRRRHPPRCNYCHRPITFFTITFSRGPTRLPFDAKPLDRPDPGSTAYPTYGNRAWDLNDLIAELQVMRGVAVEQARDEVFDMPWHRLHRCAERVAAQRDPQPEPQGANA